MSFYSKILVQGLEAEKCLQGQLTCDLSQATIDKPLLGAHCNPKGRIVYLFFLMREENGFALFVPRDIIAIAFNYLKKYTQFFKTIQLTQEETTEQDLWLTRMTAEIPWVYVSTSELFLPHDINLPQLGGVSFTKGCYTGQEIVARMQNLGRPKQHLYQLQFEMLSPEIIFQPGTKIYLPDRLDSEVGYIVHAAQKENTVKALASLKDAILMEGKPHWSLAFKIAEVDCLVHIQPFQ